MFLKIKASRDRPKTICNRRVGHTCSSSSTVESATAAAFMSITAIPTSANPAAACTISRIKPFFDNKVNYSEAESMFKCRASRIHHIIHIKDSATSQAKMSRLPVASWDTRIFFREKRRQRSEGEKNFGGWKVPQRQYISFSDQAEGYFRCLQVTE